MKRNQNKRNKRKFKIKRQQNHPLNFDLHTPLSNIRNTYEFLKFFIIKLFKLQSQISRIILQNS